MEQSEEIKRWVADWRGEMESASIYRELSTIEKDPRLAEVYRRMTIAEEHHARHWSQKIEGAGAQLPEFRPGTRARILMWLARRGGAQLVLPSLQSLEQQGEAVYRSQPDAQELLGDEISHTMNMGQLAGMAPRGLPGSSIALLEGRHRATQGNALRAAVLGANDGLDSVLSLVMGVAGANLAGRTVLISGIAGWLAGAFSMALGEWISVQSSRELYANQVQIERQEVEELPEEEKEELALIYEARGVPQDEAAQMAGEILADREGAVETLTREELGFDPEELGGSPTTAAVSSFLLFTLGAVFPVLPFVFLSGTTAVIVSIAASAVALFGVGAAITLFTGQKVLYSGFRQVLFGLVAASVTFGIGRLIGVTTGA